MTSLTCHSLTHTIGVRQSVGLSMFVSIHIQFLSGARQWSSGGECIVGNGGVRLSDGGVKLSGGGGVAIYNKVG